MGHFSEGILGHSPSVAGRVRTFGPLRPGAPPPAGGNRAPSPTGPPNSTVLTFSPVTITNDLLRADREPGEARTYTAEARSMPAEHGRGRRPYRYREVR